MRSNFHRAGLSGRNSALQVQKFWFSLDAQDIFKGHGRDSGVKASLPANWKGKTVIDSFKFLFNAVESVIIPHNKTFGLFITNKSNRSRMPC